MVGQIYDRLTLFLGGDVNCSDMDYECVNLCKSLDRMDGITTTNSHCGDGKRPMMVWFRSSHGRGLLALSRLMSHNYYSFEHRGWSIVINHSDTKPQLNYILQGPINDFEGSQLLSIKILEMVDNTIRGYNILLDKHN